MPILDGSDGGETDAYPTPWMPIKTMYGVEYRHLTLDTFQLRSITHVVTINQEGFEIYMRDLNKVNSIDDFEQWCKKNNIKIEERKT